MDAGFCSWMRVQRTGIRTYMRRPGVIMQPQASQSRIATAPFGKEADADDESHALVRAPEVWRRRGWRGVARTSSNCLLAGLRPSRPVVSQAAARRQASRCPRHCRFRLGNREPGSWRRRGWWNAVCVDGMSADGTGRS